jgi:nucleoside phosphorylase
LPLDWRETLGTLQTQFQARAAKALGLHHLFVEVADNERHKMSGPFWFAPYTRDIPMVDGRPDFGKWGMSASSGLPWIGPSFREDQAGETFASNDDQRVIRDKSGVVRAVFVPMKLRQGYYCGQPSEEVSAFESLANAASNALAAATDLTEHAFASELTDIFRQPFGGVRYVFGDVPAVPESFIAAGWQAGILQFENGVVIDVPLGEGAPDASHWVFLLHRLGWRRIPGSGLRGGRWAWKDNVEVALEMLTSESVHHPDVRRQFEGISRESYYSVLGTKDVPLDVNLASVFAIQLLLADLTPHVSPEPIPPVHVDYSRESWQTRGLPSIRPATRSDLDGDNATRIGVLVATEVERQTVLKTMRPPGRKRALLQVHCDNNTVYLGRLGAVEVLLCMTAMGSIGRDSSAMVTSELIEEWNLAAALMVGIAFGKDAKKQAIGNVLISDHIIPYEPQRVGPAGNENRGIPIPAGTVLLNRFRNTVKWKFSGPDGRECGFQLGPILSGEKLVDDPSFKEQLFERYPTAIGGEMEGAGVAAAAARKNREWIVVKGICDWGDGTKTSQHQAFAAAASVALVEHIFNQPGVLDALVPPLRS